MDLQLTTKSQEALAGAVRRAATAGTPLQGLVSTIFIEVVTAGVVVLPVLASTRVRIS